MFDQNHLSQFKQKLTQAQSVLILLPPEPDTDSLAASLSLQLSLQQSGKKVTVGCSSDVKVADSHLFGIGDIKKTIGNQTLVISFDYKEEAVENVTYDIDEEGGQFNLRVRPKKGGSPLDPSTIKYSYTGAQADLTIIIGASSLEELGSLYSDEKDFLDGATKASLNLSPTASSFADINLHTNSATSLSEATTYLLKQSGINPTADAGTNLYRQIIKTTDNFQSPKTSADTFELVAFLLRSGAQKSAPKPRSSFTPLPKREELTQPPQFFAPEESDPPHPAFTSQNGDSHLPKPPDQKKPKGIPKDWQGPKIYRGGGNLK